MQYRLYICVQNSTIFEILPLYALSKATLIIRNTIQLSIFCLMAKESWHTNDYTYFIYNL